MLLFNKNTLPREELIQCIYVRKPSILTLNAKISEVCFTDFSHIHSFYSTNELNHLWSWNDGNIPFKYKRRLCCQLFLWTSSTVNLLLFSVGREIWYIMNPKHNFVSQFDVDEVNHFKYISKAGLCWCNILILNGSKDI